MNDKYLEKVRQAEDDAAAEIVDDRLAEYNDAQKADALMMLGRAQATDRISVALSAEVIRFLEHFEKTKLYRALGHGDFVTFLKFSGLLQVTKSRYYERKKVLDKEGDPLFDALSIAGVPMSVRQHLLPGDVAVDGDSIVIKGETDEEDIIVRRDDDKTLIQSIRNLSNARRNAARDLAETKTKLEEIGEKHDEKIRERDREIDRLRTAKMAEFAADAHMTARVELGLAFGKLTDVAGNMSAAEKDHLRDDVLEYVASWSASLRQAYSTNSKDPADPSPLEGSNLTEALDNFLDNVDLDDTGNNDGELAASL